MADKNTPTWLGWALDKLSDMRGATFWASLWVLVAWTAITTSALARDTLEGEIRVATADIPSWNTQSKPKGIELVSLSEDFPTMSREQYLAIFQDNLSQWDIDEAALDTQLDQFNTKLIAFHTVLRKFAGTKADSIPEPIRLWQTYSWLFIWFPNHLAYEAINLYAEEDHKSADSLRWIILHVAPEYGVKKAETNEFLDTDGWFDAFLDDVNVSPTETYVTETDFYRFISFLRANNPNIDEDGVYDAAEHFVSIVSNDYSTGFVNLVTTWDEDTEPDLASLKKYAEVFPGYFWRQYDVSLALHIKQETLRKKTAAADAAEEKADAAEEKADAAERAANAAKRDADAAERAANAAEKAANAAERAANAAERAIN